MKKIIWTLTLLTALPLALAAQVSKEDLKKLTAAGISDDVILSYVRANGGVQRLSAEDVIELKQAGASEKVLSAALGNVPAAPAAPSYTPPPSTEQYRSAPSTTYVVDSTPYYTPSVSYSAYVGGYYGGYYPYYYPYYYGSYCSPHYYSTGYCYPHYNNYNCYSGYGGYNNCYRGYAGVSSYRGGSVSVGVGVGSYGNTHVGGGVSVGGYRGGHR
jgi:hypothetical protein